jgi:hypothetical protein
MTATVHAQNTGALPTPTGSLTVPLQIIGAAGARHRTAIVQHRALPAWALLTVTVLAAALIALAVLDARPASPALILCTLIGTAAAFAPDFMPVQGPSESAERIGA